MNKIVLVLSAVSAVLGLLVAIAPLTFAHVCPNPMMHCHAVTRPTEFVLGMLVFAVSAVQVAVQWRRR